MSGIACGHWMGVLACLACGASEQASPSQVLRHCTSNLDKLVSWVLSYEELVESQDSGEARVEKQSIRGRVCSDGCRVATWSDRWGTVGEDQVPPACPIHLALIWDGKTYTKYQKSGKIDAGRVTIDDFAAAEPRVKEGEVGALQHSNPSASLMGRYPGTSDRIDRLMGTGEELTLRNDKEEINGSVCHVLAARARNAAYRVWVDPEHGYAIARVDIWRHAGRDDGVPIRQGEDATERYSLTVLRFAQFGDAWVPIETVRESTTSGDGAIQRHVRWHMKVTEFLLDPDHDARGSFVAQDIPNGAETVVLPVGHIRYDWQDGKLIPRTDESVLAHIDATLATMLAGADPNAHALAGDGRTKTSQDSNDAPSPGSRRPRPHCGLYCVYSILRLAGQDLDYRDLVKAQYYESYKGSSLAGLNRALHDNGFYAGVVTRLSTHALRTCPYQAILHVRSSREARDYDHYELFMGTEGGQAKVFDPPAPPALVDFKELDYLWDGNALLVSNRPFDSDRIFAAEHQRLALCGLLGVLAVVLAHVLCLLCPVSWGDLTCWGTLRLTVKQVFALGFAALVVGVLYHLISAGGFLANRMATASLQRAYQGSFIPTISKARVRRFLGTQVIFVDARIARDYERGHLEGAISLPVDANDTLWKERTSAIPKDSQMVVYCQSAACKFAENVSVRLLRDGFTTISIFRAGWTEWTGAKTRAGRRGAGHAAGRHNGKA